MPGAKVRLRAAQVESTGQNGAAPAVQLRPLPVAGLVVPKAAVVEALRVYVPGLADLSVTEDGEFFWLMLAEGEGSESQAAG